MLEDFKILVQLACFLFLVLSKGQNLLFQNQTHSSQQQAQSKDMAPRFIKKGQLNADEVGTFFLLMINVSLSYTNISTNLY